MKNGKKIISIDKKKRKELKKNFEQTAMLLNELMIPTIKNTL
jgi:hypothetical protein